MLKQVYADVNVNGYLLWLVLVNGLLNLPSYQIIYVCFGWVHQTKLNDTFIGLISGSSEKYRNSNLKYLVRYCSGNAIYSIFHNSITHLRVCIANLVAQSIVFFFWIWRMARRQIFSPLHLVTPFGLDFVFEPFFFITDFRMKKKNKIWSVNV